MPGGKGICQCWKFTNLKMYFDRCLGIFHYISLFFNFFFFVASLNMYCTSVLPCCLLEEWDLKLYTVWQLKAEHFQLCLKHVRGNFAKRYYNYNQKSTNSGCLDARATKFCSMAPNIFNSIIAVLSKNMKNFCMISGFHHEVYENCALLGYYTPSSGNFLTMFWDNLSVPSSGVKSLKINPQRWDQ